MTISVYEVFELNKALHSLLAQQSSYDIKTAFKIYSLIKWLDDTEGFIFDRMNEVLGTSTIDVKNPLHTALLASEIPFVDTTLTTDELINAGGNIKMDVNSIGVLDKLLNKTEK